MRNSNLFEKKERKKSMKKKKANDINLKKKKNLTKSDTNKQWTF